ncbi:MAG: molybdopterin-dependent oxidoreductase [Ignavibacteria bacterium]|nr:molybdopterin-dependent oxidoreductase [Ignavibacteria bacterium]
MKGYDSIQHVRGESVFIDDIKAPQGTLHAYVVYSKIAHGVLERIDTSEALASPGVHSVLTSSDVTGENQIGSVIADEELLAAHHVHFIGQPVALVLADSKINALRAAKKVRMDITPLQPIFDPREAYEKGSLIMPEKIFTLGDTESAFKECDIIIEGKAESGGQEHLYLETQSALAIPSEGNGIKIFSSTQSPTAVQKITARVLGLPMNMVEVDVTRLGGGFGGKEDQATAWAALAGLGAFVTKRPVKLVLPRQEDMRITGKRHPYSSDYKIGLKKDGTILAYEAVFYQNAGASADLSPAILERTLFHCTNSYYIPHVKAKAVSCKTNLPPNTAFRGFGGPQGMFVIEAAIRKAAKKLNMDPVDIQHKNLLVEGNEFPYGQITEYFYLKRSFEHALEKFSFRESQKRIAEFNASSKLVKKGIAVMPICFGISFTTTFLNQASALIHIYTDGSISVSTAAIEMGQGVNSKVRNVVAHTIGCNHNRIKVDTTNTSRVANTSPTAASKGADLNGFAALHAAEALFDRLQKVAAAELGVTEEKSISIKNEIVYSGEQQTQLTWEQLIWKAYTSRVSLSSQAYHATPDIHFNKETSKGRPFAYHVTGTAISEVTVDCLRGIYEVDSVKIVHDIGKSLDPMIDRGQVEGALAQGIGWMTSEEVIYNQEGRLITDALSTYKVPDIYAAPKEIIVEFLEDVPNPYGPLKAKAVGEPPLMYGIGTFHAILNAMSAYKDDDFEIVSPITHERVLMYLHDSK